MEIKLKITYNKENKEILIKGNKDGLEFLSDCCLRIIGKSDPSGHIHLMPEMNNLIKGSINVIIEYTDNL